MSERNTVVRSLHDLGLAAWFGGSLAGAVGINGAAADVTEPTQRLRVANAGWGRWSPVNPRRSVRTSSAAPGCFWRTSPGSARRRGWRGRPSPNSH